MERVKHMEAQKVKSVYRFDDEFDKAFNKAWKDYTNSGSFIVDGLEDNFRECIFGKGFTAGFEYALSKIFELNSANRTD